MMLTAPQAAFAATAMLHHMVNADGASTLFGTRQERLEAKVESALRTTSISLKGESLSDSEFIDDVLPVLAESSDNSKWEVLDLSWNNLTQVAVRELGKVLNKLAKRNHVFLKALHIDCNHLGDLGLKELSSLLSTPGFNRLETLTLGFNRISDEGVNHLAKALPSTSLLCLSLECNAVNDRGIRELAGAMVLMKSLATLNLSFNPITHEGAKSLGESMMKCSCLKELALNSTSIGDSGLSSISSGLLSGKSNLAKLEVAGCNISDLGLSDLIKGVKLSDLESVNLGENMISNHAAAELDRVFTVKNSPWFKTALTLLSVKDVPRLSRGSKLAMLPKELLREVCLFLPPDNGRVLLPKLLILNFVMVSSSQDAPNRADEEGNDSQPNSLNT